MVIGIFGESCIGKDYLRLAKNENIAKVLFQKKLATAVNGETDLDAIVKELMENGSRS